MNVNFFADFFGIDPSGDVTILRSISVTSRHLANVTLNVTARDGGGLETILSLHILIIDVNDHYPIITSPTKTTFEIPEASYQHK